MRKTLYLSGLGLAAGALAIFFSKPVKTAAQSPDNTRASVIHATFYGNSVPELLQGTPQQPVHFVGKPHAGLSFPIIADGALQTGPQPLASFGAVTAYPALGFNFPGYTVSLAPPDTNAAVNGIEVVETVNLSYEVFTTSGIPIAGPFALPTLFASGPCHGASGYSLSDPVVEWDQLALRWVISYVAFNSSYTSDHYCQAVSTTWDARAAFYPYDFDVSTLGGVLATPALPDYDKSGVWPDAYYSSFNEFSSSFGNPFIGAAACAQDRAKMIAGLPATMQCFLRSAEDSLLPSDLYGATGARYSSPPPPTGAPNHYIGTIDSGVSGIHILNFHVDFTTPALSTFTGPNAVTGVAAYTLACGGGGTCIQQPSPGELLDSLGDRLMYPAAYRHFVVPPYDFEIIAVSHSVQVGATVGVRWYQIVNVGTAAPVVLKQGTYAPDAKFRWMPSVAMDKAANMAVGYSVSGSTMNPSIFVNGRTFADPAGTLETEAPAVVGTGIQKSTSHRWGDYSSMKIDPFDDCTFWYAQEYIKTTGSFRWDTALAKNKFTACP